MVPLPGNVDMRALKIAGAVVAVIIVVLALGLIVGIPSGFLTSGIEERVERETGYHLNIAGTTKISLWPSLNVTGQRHHDRRRGHSHPGWSPELIAGTGRRSACP